MQAELFAVSIERLRGGSIRERQKTPSRTESKLPSAPHYLLRDRDGSYGERFQETASWLGIHEVLTAPQSPWQNAYVERLIGSIRRECLDHVIVLNETGLRRILKSYFDYYERTRTHLPLDKDAPISRFVQPPEIGRIVEVPQVGGLHHRYKRIAA